MKVIAWTLRHRTGNPYLTCIIYDLRIVTEIREDTAYADVRYVLDYVILKDRQGTFEQAKELAKIQEGEGYTELLEGVTQYEIEDASFARLRREQYEVELRKYLCAARKNLYDGFAADINTALNTIQQQPYMQQTYILPPDLYNKQVLGPYAVEQ